MSISRTKILPKTIVRSSRKIPLKKRKSEQISIHQIVNKRITQILEFLVRKRHLKLRLPSTMSQRLQQQNRLFKSIVQNITLQGLKPTNRLRNKHFSMQVRNSVYRRTEGEDRLLAED